MIAKSPEAAALMEQRLFEPDIDPWLTSWQ
jgi:hypothetical protein